MKKLIICFTVFSALILGSCKKMLDKTPEDSVSTANFFTKETDAVLALNGVFDVYTDRTVWYGGTYKDRDIAGDDFYTILSAFPGNLLFNSSNADLSNLFRLCFTAIERANILLANIDKIPMDENRKEIIRGEALFLRAHTMFFLVDNWGPIPINLEPTKGPNDVARARKPVKEVYDQIVKDLLAAESRVPTTATPGYGGAGYIAKTTVQGILARVYLTMAGNPLKDVSKYAEAHAWLMKIYNSGEHKLNPDFTDIFIKLASDKFDPKEVMWELDFASYTGSTEWGQIGYLAGPGGGGVPFAVGSAAQTHATRLLYQAYEQGNASTNPYAGIDPSPDMRRDWAIAPFIYNNTAGGKTIKTTPVNIDRDDGKYRTRYQTAKITGQTGINFPMLRYSDVLLMLAETENYINGPTAFAYDLVNQVRRRGYGYGLKGRVVRNFVVNNGGVGYTSAPTVTVTGGGGTTQAIATATINATTKVVTAVTMTSFTDAFTDMPTYNAGSFYTAPPTVTLTGGGATTQATVTAVLVDADLAPGKTKEQFLKAIQDERFRELTSECIRHHDLIRWGIFRERLIEVRDEVQNPAYTASTNSGWRATLDNMATKFEDKFLLYPIPAEELSLNPLMTQNPGW